MTGHSEISYQLNLPPQHLVTPYQLIHLAIYLRITSLLPLLERILEVSSRPIPTPTLPLLDYVIYRRTFRIRLPRIPTPVLSHILFSALKILAMMWMLTRDMRWNDMSLWIMGGGALGWWFGDALNRFNQERRRNPPPAPAAQPAEHGRGDGNIVANTPAQVATDAPVRAAAASRANRPRMPQVSNPLTFLIPLVHLDHDARQLHLPVSSTHRAMGDLDAFANANDPTRAARVHRQPPRWKTQLCLPVMLWLVTLFPGWEAIRARAIRRRERAMRVLVGELSAGGEPVEEGQEAPRVLPEGLSPAAKAYFKRVMERGEGIDWEEEREAQRALGVGEEEPDEGRGGLGLGM